MALSKEDKADVARSMGKALANKVSKVTKDGGVKVGIKPKFAEKLFKRGALKEGMGEGEYRYKPAPSSKSPYSDQSEHYRKNRGGYVKNITGKNGKYE